MDKAVLMATASIMCLIMVIGYALIGIFGQPMAWLYATVIVFVITSSVPDEDDDDDASYQ